MKIRTLIYITSFLLCIIQASGNAQSNHSLSGTTGSKAYFSHKVKVPGSLYFPATGIQGDPYFFMEPLPGSITFTNNEVAENVPLKYDGYLDELISITNNASQFVKVDKELVSSFTIKNQSSSVTTYFLFKKLPSSLTGFKNDIYAQLLYQDSVSLWVQRKVEEKDSKEEKMVNNVKVAVRILEQRPLFLLKIPGTQLITIQKISRRKLIKALPEEHASAVKDLLREQKVRVRKEEGLVNATRVINQYFKVLK